MLFLTFNIVDAAVVLDDVEGSTPLNFDCREDVFACVLPFIDYLKETDKFLEETHEEHTPMFGHLTGTRHTRFKHKQTSFLDNTLLSQTRRSNDVVFDCVIFGIVDWEIKREFAESTKRPAVKDEYASDEALCLS